MNALLLCDRIKNGSFDDCFLDMYVDAGKIEYQKNRYINAISRFRDEFADFDIEIYSAPGRSEIGGNHTDHQNGEVLAAAVNLDAIAVVGRTTGEKVCIYSEGFGRITVDTAELELCENEKGSALALTKGVLDGIRKHGYHIGGFAAYITSDVLIGAGLSSSAAYEILIGTIISGMYNNMRIPAEELAVIGQYAENVFFGKPCGLMDQMACSVGNMIHVDFLNPQKPDVERVDFDINKHGYSLCITDTGGSHADLTDEYAAVPSEMKLIAAYFGKEVLRGLTMDDLTEHLSELRDLAGDRAVLRAIHFINENERVKKEVQALKNENIEEFLRQAAMSGNSSFKYLQNVYTNNDVLHQNLSLALAVSEDFLGENGVCRVHGGGFAGTIQAFVRNKAAEDYRNRMDKVFGSGACSILKIRKYGGIRVFQ